jgi:adenylate cyclase class 2
MLLMHIEHEVKIAYADAASARQAILGAGATPDIARRLIDDQLFDTADGRLRQAQRALRLRRDADRAILTAKGPPLPGPVKSREELETTTGDADITLALLRALGFEPQFRAQKYREEFVLGAARLTIDETPIGVFIEIEAAPDDIVAIAARLGHAPGAFRLESYARLYQDWCESKGLPPGDMTFA